MNTDLNNRFEELLSQIPHFLKERSILVKHLAFMRNWTNFEWFNIASVLYAKDTATIVKTTDSWSKMYQKEILPKKTQKGLPIFLPLYDKDDIIHFKEIKVFDISQMATNITPTFQSPLKTLISKNTSKMETLIRITKNKWHTEIINKAIEKQAFIKEYPAIQPFVFNCCFYIHSDLFKLSDNVIENISLNLLEYTLDDSFDYIGLYKAIKDTIADLPNELQQLMFVVEEKEQQVANQEKLKKFENMSIEDMIKEAKDFVNNKDENKLQSYQNQEEQQHYDIPPNLDGNEEIATSEDC